eukprot:1780725-Prymnesium_polylepis.1
MAQLFSAFGSIIAIVAGARDYNSQCVSNVVLWENPTGTIAKDKGSLELLLMKPNQEPLVTWTSIFRATMSNLTLVTIGIAVKNFITRTASAKADVVRLCMPEASPVEKVGAFRMLVEAMKNGGRATIQSLASLHRFLNGMCGGSCSRRSPAAKGFSM